LSPPDNEGVITLLQKKYAHESKKEEQKLEEKKKALENQESAPKETYLNYKYSVYKDSDGKEIIKTPLRVIRKKTSEGKTYLAYKILSKSGKFIPATFGNEVKNPDKPCLVHFRNNREAWYWADNSRTPHVVILDVVQFEALVGNFAVEEFVPFDERRKELF